MKWVRSSNGALFGVCKGLAQTLGISVGVFRLLWLFSVLFFGMGVALYLMLAISLPREDRVAEALDPWILGVCSRIALRTDLEVGIVRFLAICLAFLSFGATLVGYVVMYFVMDDVRPKATVNQSRTQSSDNKPATPPEMI
ncbi:MAG: PspC domain-containing protein [Bdellovibrionaceae bacterium]|nr:PspC domain-containing protein [Pseudobdellovibrionaceae bacterium]